MGKKLLFILAVPFLFSIASFAAPQAAEQPKPAANEPIALRQSPAAEAAMRDSRCCDALQRQNDLAHQVVKTYYLKYLKSPTEIQDVVNGMRTILEFQRVQPVMGLPAVVVRGSAEQIAGADKLVADLDRPRSTAGGLSPTSGENYRLDYTLTEMDAGKKVATHNYSVIVQRGRNYDDAKKTSFKVGSKMPIATGSFQPGIGGVGTRPLVNTQFNYQDVGVNIDCRLYGPEDDLTLNSSVELSNVAGSVDIGGLSQPIVRQARSDSTVSLLPGKTATVAGLDSVESPRRVDVEVVATRLK